MIRHYVKIFFRNLKRHPLTSAINFFSLVLGIAFSLVLISIIVHEMPDDRFHDNYFEIHRLQAASGTRTVNSFPRSVHPWLEERFPEINEAFSYSYENNTVKIGDREHSERMILAAPGFFRGLSFHLEAGDPESALEQPNLVYLTEKKALELFGHARPLGETLEIRVNGQFRELMVGGIVGDYPLRSSIEPDFVLSSTLMEEIGICPDLTEADCHDRLYLWITGDPVTFQSRLKDALPDLSSRMDRYDTDALEHIAVVSTLREPDYNHFPIYIGIFLGLLILALACFNYVNNTIAATAVRFREIGIRKVLGSDRRRISAQFFAESFLTVLVASILTVGLLLLFMPLLSSYISYLTMGNVPYTSDHLFSRYSLMILAVLIPMATLLSGAWPALMISRFQPSLILKNRNAVGGAPRLSRALVGFQMVISVIILVLILSAGRSLSAMDEDYYGYRTEGIVEMTIWENASDDSWKSVYPQFVNLMKNRGYALPAAGMRRLGISSLQTVEVWDGERNLEITLTDVTPSFFQLMEIPFSKTEPLSRETVTADSSLLVINSVLKDQLGWEQATGNIIRIGDRSYAVAGVLENFRSFEGGDDRTPFAFMLIPDSKATRAVIDVEASPRPRNQTLEDLRAFRKELMESDQREVYLWDAQFTRQEGYLAYMIELLTPITAFSLFLCALGLFSLTSFSVSRRLKEISIRKVNGATPGELVHLLLREYALIGAAAFLVALPAGHALSNLLIGIYTDASGSFVGLFITSLVSLTLFILICVGYQVYFAARENPVKYLKEE